MTKTTTNPRAKTEAKLRAVGAKAAPKGKPAKAADPKADKAVKARNAAELAAVLQRETAFTEASHGARVALIACIAGRFTDHVEVTAADLAPIYANAKTARNRAAELESYRRTGAVLGKAPATRLLEAVAQHAERLRDAWASVSASARKDARERIAAGTDKAVAQVGAVKSAIDELEAKAAERALRGEVQVAKGAMDKANRKAVSAHTALANAGPDTPKSVKAELTKAVTQADKAAKAAADTHAVLSAKLPKPAPVAPKSPAAIVQDVKAAMGDTDLPLAALAAMARDLVARFRAAGDAKAADAIGKAIEHIAA